MKTIRKAGFAALGAAMILSGSIDAFAAAFSRGYCFDNSKMYSYDELITDLNSLKKEYAGEVPLSITSLGSTSDGRQLPLVSVGNREADKKVLITAAIHGREYISTQLVMLQLRALLSGAKEGESYKDSPLSEMLESVEVYFVPMVNPDGVTLCQYGPEAMRKEETLRRVEEIYEADGAKDPAEYFNQWKANARGVDLNRNFDADWEEYDDGVYRPSADHYKGEYPESEEEARALAELTREKKFDRTISYHTQGEVIYWYYKQEGELKDISFDFAEMASRETGYFIDSDYESLDQGGYKDWAILKEGIPSLTIEVGKGRSPVEPWQIEDIYEENKNICIETMYEVFKEGDEKKEPTVSVP